MTYNEKLRSPLWQRKRLEILQRDGFSCVRCGDNKENLQVHHIKYIRGKEPWEYENDCLEALCSTCHFVATYYNREPFLIIKPHWKTTKQTRIILAYLYISGEMKTAVLRLNFIRKTIKELSKVPVNLNLLNQ